MFERIRWRLVAWAVLVFGLLLLLVSAAVYLTLSRSLLAQADHTLAAMGDADAASLHELTEGIYRFDREGYAGGRFALVLAPDGRVLADPQHLDLTRIPLGRLAASPPTFLTVTLGGEPDRLYIRPLPGASNGAALLVVGQSLEAEEQVLRRLLAVLLATGGGGLLLSLAGAWFLAGRALVPIQRAFARQQEFVADASHELRTPLTVLRAATDLLYQRRAQPLLANERLLEDVRQEIARLERLAGDLLTLARSDRGQLELAVGEVDLTALADDTVRRLLPLARDRGVDLHSGGDAAVIVEGDPDRLQQALLILLDNALKYTPRGGSVDVRATRQGQEALLEVRDTGEGIAPEHLAHIFDRFFRADPARAQGGTGLGLAIARTLAEAHGGTLSLASTPGVGTVATLLLPLPDNAPALSERLGDLAGRLTHRHERSELGG